MKFRVITSDCPWDFGDKLSMNEVARGAAANYPCLDLAAIKALPVAALAEDDAVLGLWCPSSMLQDGLDVMKAWGFRQVQEWIWVKLTSAETQISGGLAIHPDGTVALEKKALLLAMAGQAPKSARIQDHPAFETMLTTSLPLVFGMGRLARSCKETFLVGVRGSPYKQLSNRSIRDVFFAPAGRHSEKPECFQDALDEMFPEGNRLEMFARRQRGADTASRFTYTLVQGAQQPPDGAETSPSTGIGDWSGPRDIVWTCVGNECPATPGEDIRDSLKRLLND